MIQEGAFFYPAVSGHGSSSVYPKSKAASILNYN